MPFGGLCEAAIVFLGFFFAAIIFLYICPIRPFFSPDHFHVNANIGWK